MMVPADVWALTYDESKKSTSVVQKTFLNAPLLNSITFSTLPESIYYQGGNNTVIQAWFIKPLGWTSGSQKKWPLALLVHGGPEGAWLDSWSYRWNPQLWATRGYAVVAPNPHGSTGFGQAFTDAVQGNWGGTPYNDIMSSVDYVISTNSWIDSNNLVACGASYGGFMIDWIAGQTNRFKALVTHDGLFDTFSGYFNTDELWFPETEFGGLPWENPAGFTQYSPMNYVKNWVSPMLVIHGGHDYRLPDVNGISVFTACQRRGIPSKLLYFPQENHWVLKDSNGILWYDTVLGWLDQWSGNIPPSNGSDIAVSIN